MTGKIVHCQSILIVLKSNVPASIYGGPAETLAEHRDKVALPRGALD